MSPLGRPASPLTRLAAVVVNYRSSDETLAAVHSLRASRRPPEPIIVVDNGSADGSAGRIAAAGCEVALVALGRNLGFAGGANAGIRMALEAGAHAVLLLNSDARVHPDCVDRLKAALVDPQVGVVGPTLLGWDTPYVIESIGMEYSPWSGRMRQLGAGQRLPCRPGTRIVDGIVGTAMLIRRDVFEAIGLLDEAYFFYCEDLDFCVRARRAGFRSMHVSEAIAWHRGAHSIGPRSPDRIYWATRSHLRLASRALPLPGPLSFVRSAAIVALNGAHLVARRAAPLWPGARAWLRAVWHHLDRHE